jgi:hypothetical protein
VRRGTFIAIIVLFVLLAAALVYQLTLGGRGSNPACGPATPNALPTKGACPSPTPSTGPT